MIYSTGLPAHNWPDGINLPGGTTELGPIADPFSIFAPSRITVLAPITT
jgi:hypothetical protein